MQSPDPVSIINMMENTGPYPEEDLTAIADVLDAVKTARYQLGTLSHMSEDLEQSVSRLRAWLEKLLRFFSDKRRVTLVAASIIIAAAVVNFIRGWISARFLRSWFDTFDARLTHARSVLHREARDITRADSRLGRKSA